MQTVIIIVITIAALAGVTVTGACRKPDAIADRTEITAPATVTPATPAAATAPNGGSASAASAYTTNAVTARLTYEAAHRPTTGLRAETIFTALAAIGITPKPKQCMGQGVGAAYCIAGATDDGLVVSITEFATPAEAQAGRATSQKRFGTSIPNRRQVLRGATMLTLSSPTPTPLLDKAQAVFDALPLSAPTP